MDSGYPTSDVVNTASPLIFVFAPKLLPWKIGPSLIVNVARSYEGLVERVETLGVETRGVPFTTVALKRSCAPRSIDLAVKLAVGLNVVGLLHNRENINVAIFNWFVPSYLQGRF